MEFRDSPAPGRSGDVVDRDPEVHDVASCGAKPLDDAAAKRRAVGEHGFETRPRITGRRKNGHPDGVEREDAAAAAARLHFLHGCLDERVNNLEGLPRAGLNEVSDPPIDRARNFRFEVTNSSKNIHALHFPINPASVAAVTISPAAGAAVAPPYPACSTRIAKAIRFFAVP